MIADTARWKREEPLACPEFFGVAPLFAVAVLAVNDAWLKQAFHNALTGKLSDLAGCFALPLFTSALLSLAGLHLRARVVIGAVATTVLFGAIKVSAAAAALVCEVLGPLARALGIAGPLHIVADPTDLIALALVPLAVLYARRVAGSAWSRSS